MRRTFRFASCLLLLSHDLVGWMLAPYYLADHDLTALDAYKRSQLLDKENKFWNLRLTAVFSLVIPTLLFGILRYFLLKPADFENYQLDLHLRYLISILPWAVWLFVLFLRSEIYRRLLSKPI